MLFQHLARKYLVFKPHVLRRCIKFKQIQLQTSEQSKIVDQPEKVGRRQGANICVLYLYVTLDHKTSLKSHGYICSNRAPAVTLPILFTPPCWQARTAKSEYEMNGASISFKATESTAHFNSKDIDLYIAKLNRLNITDPYNALRVLLTCIYIWMDRFPDLKYPDMYNNYLINCPS